MAEPAVIRTDVADHPETARPIRSRTEEPHAERMPPWLSSTPAVLTVITFITMMAGLVAGWRGAGPTVTLPLYGIAYVAGGVVGLRSSIASLRKGVIDIDLLMILAALGALVIGAPFEGAMLLFLFSLSNVLQGLAMGRTRRAIEALMVLRPDEAVVVAGGREVVRPLDDIVPGTLIRVKPGSRIPLDGVVTDGTSMVDQSSITGESVPVHRDVGDSVFAGTFNQDGSLDIRVSAHASESTLARLIELVEDAQREKAVTQRVIERIEQIYAVAVLVLTGAAIAIPLMLLGEAFQPTFYRAMTLMVAASPCAIVISTPATVLSAIGNGARHGVLFKGGVYVEQASTIRVLAFDKTGTLTAGRPDLTDLIPLGDVEPREVLARAAGIQQRSEHHLAAALLEAARSEEIALPPVSAFRADPGRGVEGRVGGVRYRLGGARYFADLPQETQASLDHLASQGKTAILMTREVGGREEPIAVMGFQDRLRPGAREVIEGLRRSGIDRIVMLTGDNEDVAAAIATEAGVDEYHAALLPEEKVAMIGALEAKYGPIAMVGDGVNDAPALASASLGIAMGAAGTDVALETADIVLMADDLAKLPYLIALSRATRRTLIANLTFAIGIIIVMIATILTIGLPLPLAVVGHEGSTVLVSLNGLRLLAFRRRNGHRTGHTLAPAASAIRA